MRHEGKRKPPTIILRKYLMNYRFFQELTLIGNGEFNHLTNILTSSSYIQEFLNANMDQKN
jgi:hypothetical protein